MRASGLAALSIAALLAPSAAYACGCFVPPDPTVPVLQAGERILFSIDEGKVTAHIQIQYAGNAGEFGWLLPLPTVPTLELGTDELFNQLITQTQPKYRLQQRFEGCSFQATRGAGGPPNAGLGGSTAAPGSEDASGGFDPLVIQDSVGPFDYAVLRADSKDAMLGWLEANRYFVPAGTDDSVGPYIRPGAYFLALKLRSGESVGDIQPVVVRYASDLPMIPIVLTSVAAQPNMGIQVWMLGAGRAIPRNYFHTVINDALIDWRTGGQNYNDVVIRAVSEAPRKHSFVTEFAGSSSVMWDVLDASGRFGTKEALAAQPDVVAFTEYLWRNGFPLSSQVLSILGRYIPYPAGLEARGVGAASFYQALRYYLGAFRQQNPDAFADWPGVDYQPAAMAAELHDRVVAPTLAAGALFKKHAFLTRLYTTLSPEDMTRDPVFSFNPSLPGVSNVHQASITYYCSIFGPRAQNDLFARLVTEQGYVVEFPNGTGPGPIAARVAALPASTGIQILREEGAPEVVADNTKRIRDGLRTGCSAAGSDAALPAVLAALLVVVALRRRRS